MVHWECWLKAVLLKQMMRIKTWWQTGQSRQDNAAAAAAGDLYQN